MLTIAVITISDRAHRGEYADRSGPVISATLRAELPGCQIRHALVPDEPELIRQALASHLGCDFIITTGGTGISPRDVTPDVTRAFCSRELPGIGEWLRRESQAETPFAVFSRAYAGVRERTIVINLPGSVGAVTLCARLLAPIMPHGKEMLLGGSHEAGAGGKHAK
jgi:molybdopterin adenylyltransferase